MKLIADTNKAAAPDIEGNSGNLLNFYFHNDSVLVDLLVDLINHILNTGESPDSWKRHYITLIEKRSGILTAENLANDLRPISIINEYSKLVSKLLAKRLGNCLLTKDVLSPAQRAFIKNGSTHHCISTLINVLEDAKHKRALSPGHTLYFTSYDQAKAYDSVQFFSIKASLERFNLPDSFIKYVLNIHLNIRAAFKTFYGLTETFEIENSIKQGDPLAPLVFIFITDALHEGLQTSPILTDGSAPFTGGYRFISSPLDIASIGFADDLTTFSETWLHHWAKHQWIRTFFTIHCHEINVLKTIYIISDAIKDDSRWLYSIDGKTQIKPSPSNTNFRFLGIHTNLNLSWAKQSYIMEATIINWCKSIRKSEISSLKAQEAYKIYLLPRLDLGLTFADIPVKTCNRWTRRVLRTILSADFHPTELSSKLSANAFSDLTNCPFFLDRKYSNQLKELIYNLNSPASHAGLSTSARIYNLTKNYNMGSLYVRRLLQKYKTHRFASLIEYWKKNDVL